VQWTNRKQAVSHRELGKFECRRNFFAELSNKNYFYQFVFTWWERGGKNIISSILEIQKPIKVLIWAYRRDYPFPSKI
jgi:hypothetical protein